MIKKVIITALGIGIGIFLSLFFNVYYYLPSGAMHSQVIKHRDIAIERAKADGVYNCCYQPGCTMCYMEANEWNNHQAGTCACADLIAQGKEPCPQCRQALSENENYTCDFSSDCDK